MKKLLTILLVLVAIASIGREVTKTGFVQTGAAIIAPAMRFSTTTDYVTANDTFNIDITCKQNYTQIINYSITMDSISGNPSVSIQLQGRVFETDGWTDLGSPITWDDMADNPLAGSYLTANTYRLYRIRLIASGTTQRANITAFLFRSTLTAGGTTTQGVNIGTSQAIYGTTAMTIGNGGQTVAVNSSDWDISSTGVMTGIGAITSDGLITAGAGVNLGTSQALLGTTAITIGNNTQTVAVNSSDWDISTAGVMTGIGAITSDGLITATGGLTIPTTPSVFYAAGGAPIIAATGTDVACANGNRFWVEVNIPYNVTITGVGVLLGSVGGTDSICVQLFNAAGTQVATTRVNKTATLLGTTATFQNIAFASTYSAVAGKYFVAVQFNGTTGKFRAYPIVGSKFITGTAAGTWGTAANITPGTSFTADKGPICFLY
jgi:hypothetical protein